MEVRKMEFIYTKIQPRYHGQRMRLHDSIKLIRKKIKKIDRNIFLCYEVKYIIRNNYIDMLNELEESYKNVIEQQYEIYGKDYIDDFYKRCVV